MTAGIEVLRKTGSMPNVAWVRVVLHDGTEIEKLVNCEWLCSDGVISIKNTELNVFHTFFLFRKIGKLLAKIHKIPLQVHTGSVVGFSWLGWLEYNRTVRRWRDLLFKKFIVKYTQKK